MFFNDIFLKTQNVKNKYFEKNIRKKHLLLKENVISFT